MSTPHKNETIREWYHRTTNKWMKGLIGATCIALVSAVFLYALATTPFLAKLQTFNGAMTIPVAGAIWLLSFVYIFLVPNREVGFRSMESLERMEDRVSETLEKKLLPAVEVWKRVGEAVEAEIKNGLIKELREAVQEFRATCKRLEKAAQDGETLAKDAKPVIEALKRLEGRVEEQIESGFFDDARAAISSVRELTLPKDAELPSIDTALAGIRGGKP